MQVGGGLTHLSIETAVMASRSLTQNSSRCDQPEKIITFGKQTCRLLDKTKPYQRRKLRHPRPTTPELMKPSRKKESANAGWLRRLVRLRIFGTRQFFCDLNVLNGLVGQSVNNVNGAVNSPREPEKPIHQISVKQPKTIHENQRQRTSRQWSIGRKL